MSRIISEELTKEFALLLSHQLIECQAPDRPYYQKMFDDLRNAPTALNVTGVREFLEQIVKVKPDGKDLWIQTVKIRASQYLSELATLQPVAGQVGGCMTTNEFRILCDGIVESVRQYNPDGCGIAFDLDRKDAVAYMVKALRTQPQAQVYGHDNCPKCNTSVSWPVEGNTGTFLKCPKCLTEWPTPQPQARENTK